MLQDASTFSKRHLRQVLVRAQNRRQNDSEEQLLFKTDRSSGRGSLFCVSMMYAALLSGCMFAAALAPARLPNSRIMRQPGLSWTGLYDELGRPVTMDELRRQKFPAGPQHWQYWQDATDSREHPIWQEQLFYGADGPEPLKDPWGHMMRNLLGSRYFQREGLPQYLFHYTSSDAGARIFETGQLLPSVKKETGDASEGDGV